MKNPISKNPARSLGFTLVELLVTITIIAALATLIFVGAIKAREKADLATTITRIKGLGLANAAYAADHNGKYVPVFSFDDEGSASGVVQWHFNTTLLGSLVGPDFELGEFETFDGADGFPENVLDPIAVRAKKKHWSRISASYGYSQENIPNTAWGQPGNSPAHRMGTIPFPERTCQFITATDWLARYPGRYAWKNNPVEGKSDDGKIAYRYQGKAVVVYYDGHVGTITMADMKRFDQRGGYSNPFWGGGQ